MIRIHRGPRIQAGRGFSSILSAGLRWLRPAAASAFRHAAKFANSEVGKKLKKTVIKRGKKAALNAVTSKLKGEDVKKTLKNEIQSAKDEIRKVISNDTSKKTRRVGRKRKALLD